MLKLVLLCVLGLAMGQEGGNTRLFGQGLGGVVGGLLSGLNGGIHGGHGGIHGGHGGIPGGHGGIHGGIGVVPGGIQGQSSSCRYWCKTPQGQNYCCESGSKPPGPVGRKPGLCPVVRLECPPTRFFGGPQTCSNDYSCSGSDKCCYDTCLGEHVCKPPQYNPNPFGRR